MLMLYLRLTYYQAQKLYITLSFLSLRLILFQTYYRDIRARSVTSEQQERSVAADLMEVSSLYGSHRAAIIGCVCDLTEVSL